MDSTQLSKSNIVYIEFYDKRNFPPGEWLREPDYCAWEYKGHKCVAIRDMKLGTWKGFVGITREHPAFNKSLIDIFNEKWGLCVLVHGGICIAGKLPPKYKELNKNHWWFGFECSQGEDILPLAQLDKNDPMFEAQGQQSYKNLMFVRREVHDLVDQLLELKVLWEY